MTSLTEAVETILEQQRLTKKPIAIVLAGHNGSGKSTMWRRSLANTLQLPLSNADRLMLAILPEPEPDGHLIEWAARLRDKDRGWMRVAQQSVYAFIGHAIGAKVPFAMETVFSDWRTQADGTIRSKIDLIREMQNAGYFVLLLFVGLASVDLSVFRVETRAKEGGHDVERSILFSRFSRTHTAIGQAISIANAAVLVDNSQTPDLAFSVCRVQLGKRVLYDARLMAQQVSYLVRAWLDVVAPLQ